MLRIVVLARVAASLGYVPREQQESLVAAYREAIAKDPSVPFIKWAVMAGHLTDEEARTVKKSYPTAPLRCAGCGHPFTAGESDIRHPIACPSCRSSEVMVLDGASPTSSGRIEAPKTLELGGDSGHGGSDDDDDVFRASDLVSRGASGGGTAAPQDATVQLTAADHARAAASADAEENARRAVSSSPIPSSKSDGASEHAYGPADGLGEIGVIPPGAVIGGCRVIQKVGQGGMGAVYKSHHLALDKTVALKVLAPHLVESRPQILRFIREARSAAQLEHPNIVQVMNVGEQQRKFYLVMQWVDGESLQRRLDREGRIPIEETLDLVLQSAEGLACAHRGGIIHRDVKPDNFMFSEAGVVKVADFGLAKQTESDLNVSQTGVILGTPYYMSPEQGQNIDVDHRTDIYSLGITIYHLLTGKLPFTGPSAVSIIFKHVKEPLPSARLHQGAIPPQLDDLIFRMTEKDPGKRPQSMEEVIRELKSVRASIHAHGLPSADQAALTQVALAESLAAEQAVGKRKVRTVLFLVVILLALAASAFGYYDRYLREQHGLPILGFTTIASASEDDDASDGNLNANRPDANNPDGNNATANTGDGDGDNASVNNRTNNAIGDTERNRRARNAFNAVDADIRSNPSDYPTHLAALDDLAQRFGNTAVGPIIEERRAEVRQTQSEQAAAYFESIRASYEAYMAEMQYALAAGLLRAFPATFNGTRTHTQVRQFLRQLSPLVEREREAARLHDEIVAGIEGDAPDFGRLEARIQTLEQRYADTRFGALGDDLRDRIVARRLDANRRIETSMLGDIRRELRAQYLDAMNYRGALEFLADSRSRLKDAQGNDLTPETQSKFDELVDGVIAAATERFDRDMQTAQDYIDARRFDDALDAIDGVGTPLAVEGYGLPEQREQAAALRERIRQLGTVYGLELFEENGEYAAGLARCDEWLSDPQFVEMHALIRWHRVRFECFEAGMVFIPAATIELPNAGGEVRTPAFFIDATEITNQHFLEFIQDGGYSEDAEWWDDLPDDVSLADWHTLAGGNTPGPRMWRGHRYEEGSADLPVTSITYYEAQAYARWRGNDIPSLLLWRVAAGWDAEAGHFLRYPWGAEFEPPGRPFPANLRRDRVDPELKDIRTYEVDCSPAGCFDMGGNAREWTSSPFPGRDGYHQLGGASFNNREPESMAMIFPAERDHNNEWRPRDPDLAHIERADPKTSFRTIRLVAPRPE